MENGLVKDTPVIEEKCFESLPNPLFSQIRYFFQESGIFGHKLSLEYEGNLYRICCNERAFIVYQVNKHQGLPPGIPGWPVCMVNSDPIFQECKTPTLPESYLTYDLEPSDWLEIIRQYRRDNL